MKAQRPATALDPDEVAVIIPVLNEAARLSALLNELHARAFSRVIVADGGSTDGSAAIARAHAGVRIVDAPRGRARQQNAGAVAAADAGVLLFLHADTRLPLDAVERMERVLAQAGAGCFRLRFDRRHPLLDLYGLCSHVDSYWTSFGDQAFFMTRAAYDAVGGFPDQPLLEDVAMRRRLKRRVGFVKARADALTSARRFEAEGLVRRQVKNAAILLLYAFGVSPAWLVRLYR